MEENFKEAFYEVEEVMKLLPKELLDKIPSNFKKVIAENKSTTYKRNGIKLENIKELKKETRVILYHIYRDFLVNSEEEQMLKNEEYEAFEEKYSYEKLFEKQSIEKSIVTEKNEETSVNLELIEYEKPKWYVKIINFFKSKL